MTIFLMQNGANCELKNKEEVTPLDLANPGLRARMEEELD